MVNVINGFKMLVKHMNWKKYGRNARPFPEMQKFIFTGKTNGRVQKFYL